MLLQLRELRQGGFEPIYQRVQTAEEMLVALRGREWDLVLADYALPSFDGLAALRLVQASSLDLPFILISGTVGEDIAVECMKAGAHDYLLKDNLLRLVPAVRRELNDAAERHRARDQQRRLEAQLVQSQKLEALGTLASGIAHDFNNILTGLTGYVDMVRADTIALPVVQENVRQISQGIQRATDLVQRILSFSRKRTVHRRPMHLGPVVQEALALLRPLIPASVAVQVNLAAECPMVLADASQIHQILINLTTNAVQAMDSRGGVVGGVPPAEPPRLTVTLQPLMVDMDFATAHPPLVPGAHVKLTVSDNGSGMDGETLNRLFEPFFTTKPPGVGTGLGLAMVKNIVENHAGAITVASALGRGSTFALHFPAAEGSALPGSTNPTMLLGHGERVLFVDDEELLTRMGEAMLSRLGYRVTTCTDPQKALKTFLAEPAGFDVLVTDLSMPGLKGTDLAMRMRQVRPDLPVILTTGYSGQKEMERAQALGFHRVLEKPYSVEKISTLLGLALAGI
jgi:signal transduction histidine kinase